MYHISVTLDVTTEEAEALTAPVTRHMEQSRCQWHFVKEEDPLWYSVLLNDFYEEVHGYRLEYLDHYTEWIKPRGWCHKVILEREQLNYCKHLTGVEPPPDDVERPSESTLHFHWAAYEAAKWVGTGKTFKRARSTLLETLAIHELEDKYYYILGGKKGPPPNNSEMVPMEVCGEGRMAASQGGGMHPWVISRSPGRNRSRQKRSGSPRTTLAGNCLRLHREAQLPLPHPLWPPLLMMTGSYQSGEGSPKIKGPGIPPRILLPDGGPLRPLGHLSPFH